MKDDDKNIIHSGSEGPRYESREGGPFGAGGSQKGGIKSSGITIKAGPLLGIPLVIIMFVLMFFLSIVALIIMALGGKRLAAMMLNHAKKKGFAIPGVEYRQHQSRNMDPDVIDVEGEEIEPPKADDR